MRKNQQKTLPRKADLQFLWVTRELGPQWESWRAYAAEWMTTQHLGVGERLAAFGVFFKDFLHALNLPTEPARFLRRMNGVPDFFETACTNSMAGMKYSRVRSRWCAV
jgi:hypothetical protein